MKSICEIKNSLTLFEIKLAAVLLYFDRNSMASRGWPARNFHIHITLLALFNVSAQVGPLQFGSPPCTSLCAAFGTKRTL